MWPRIAVGFAFAALAAFLMAAIRQRSLRLAAQRQRDHDERQVWRLRLDAAAALLKRNESNTYSWSGFRKFTVSERHEECAGVVSFTLLPHDRRPLPSYLPGQFLTFKIKHQHQVIRRCYSLSDAPDYPIGNPRTSSILQQPSYRVTIKRIEGPEGPGICSNYFHDQVQVGTILDVAAPSGYFVLDPEDPRPVVFLAAGIGVTPLFSMVRSICNSGRSHQREVWFFLGIRDREHGVFRESLEQLAHTHDNLNLHICYSQLPMGTPIDRRFEHRGRISIDLLKQLLPANNYSYLMCGPESMMTGMRSALRDWGVPDDDIQQEVFSAIRQPLRTTTPTAKVTFAKSDMTCVWNAEEGSILDFATAHGIVIDSGCRAGSCGSCMTAIRSGEVDYVSHPGTSIEDGSCLTCIAVPKTDLIIDA